MGGSADPPQGDGCGMAERPTRIEDVFPIENGDFPLLCLITGGYIIVHFLRIILFDGRNPAPRYFIPSFTSFYTSLRWWFSRRISEPSTVAQGMGCGVFDLETSRLQDLTLLGCPGSRK